MIPWDSALPGLVIDPRRVDIETYVAIPTTPTRRADFIWATRTALHRIASKPIGRDLLGLISKRCVGIGAQGPMTCRIMLGEDTVLAQNGIPTPQQYAQGAVQNTYAAPSLDINDPYKVKEAQTARMFRRSKPIEHLPMWVSGGGFSTFVCWNPFIDYDLGSVVKLGVPTPGFLALAHELVHALHMLSGDKVKDEDPWQRMLLEEARTIGCGRFAGARISENAMRREHGIKERAFYATPGDCDAANLG
ncbi:M91 family zinc metallopeptidase [Falsiroseomonas ponticola]|uniref:M91 family zinc metallopeptidase n=1 Tax=Falsiroseomonas ponticola TaxID=2786951 RepID=UPI0019345BD1|nr:M91 family zinc metallopeptidase [Roseomonas ponticola]